jgi:adenylate cyclase
MAVERRHAAVLVADVVGYSRLMGADELGTLETLHKLRLDLVEPALALYKGRIVRRMVTACWRNLPASRRR